MRRLRKGTLAARIAAANNRRPVAAFTVLS
jgi:hypothetical protein